jgi:protein subunit release factor B
MNTNDIKESKKRRLLFSVTAADCRWDYYRGSGAGGQKRNKTSSAARCTHVASGAMGCAEDGRSQLHNKQMAFRRMVDTKKFQVWMKLEKAKRLGIEAEIERDVELAMRDRNLKVEIKDESGLWKQVDVNAPLSEKEE